MESSLPSYSSSNVKYVVNAVIEKISTPLCLTLNRTIWAFWFWFYEVLSNFFFFIAQTNFLRLPTLSEVATGEGAKALLKMGKEHCNDWLLIFFSHHWIFRCLFLTLYYWIHLVIFISLNKPWGDERQETKLQQNFL